MIFCRCFQNILSFIIFNEKNLREYIFIIYLPDIICMYHSIVAACHAPDVNSTISTPAHRKTCSCF